MNYKYNLSDWVDSLKDYLAQRELCGTGRYCRYKHESPGGRGACLDAYGVADLANILYTIGDFPQNPR